MPHDRLQFQEVDDLPIDYDDYPEEEGGNMPGDQGHYEDQYS